MARRHPLLRVSLVALSCFSSIFFSPSHAAAEGHAAPAEVVAPVRLDEVPIPYPDGAEGDSEVVLELEIEKDGTVGNVVVIDGAHPFSEAARVAARTFRFSPALRNGLAIRARIRAKIAFHHPDPPPVAAASHSPSESVAEAPPSVAPPAPPQAIEVSAVGETREELGSTHIPRSETRLVPGAFADPFRVIEVLPGVAPVVSGVPYFTIRGSPPGDVGYYIDGIRVPLLFHVGAGPSVIAAGLVDRVDLFSSVYPARFGRYAGGIIAGETMRPSDVAHGEAQARIFDAGGMAEQPFANGKGSVALGGRYGYTGALLSIVAPDYSLAYWDYQARVSYRVSAHDRVTLFSFGASDYLRNEAIARTLFDVQFHRIDARWDHDTDDGHWRIAATVSSDATLNAEEKKSDPGSSTKTRGVRLRMESDQRLSHEVRWRAGADVGVERFAADNEVHGNAYFFYGAHTDPYGGAWTDFVLRPHRSVEIVPSFRVDVLRARGETIVAPEPRLFTRLRVASGISWISAMGVVHQAPTFLVPVPGANLTPAETANQVDWQVSQAVELSLPSRMSAKITAFRSVGFLTDIDGRGHNYGLEFFLHRDFTERLGGFLSYTLSRADRASGVNQTLSTFDRPHVLSLVLGYNLGNGYRLGGRLFMESGRPYVAQCPNPECRGTPGGPVPYTVTGRYPMFMRVDFRFEKKWTFASGTSISATFEWFNSLLKREIDNVQLTPGGLVIGGRSPLTLPSIGVEVSY